MTEGHEHMQDGCRIRAQKGASKGFADKYRRQHEECAHLPRGLISLQGKVCCLCRHCKLPPDEVYPCYPAMRHEILDPKANEGK